MSIPLSAGTFVQTDRVAGMVTGTAASRDVGGRDLHVELAGFVSPLNLSFFFARMGIRALRGSLQEARRLG
jgi:hypothetical protein